MKASQKQFLAAVAIGGDTKAIAKRLGMAPQSVYLRLERYKRRGLLADAAARQDFKGFGAKELERRYFAALDMGTYPLAQDCFAEMCQRLEEVSHG